MRVVDPGRKLNSFRSKEDLTALLVGISEHFTHPVLRPVPKPGGFCSHFQQRAVKQGAAPSGAFLTSTTHSRRKYSFFSRIQILEKN
ncbi:hypothetical protein O181_033001 [Austropuccinia psidii MF-1]|uniref:Uncharacterized protein n=1 Tax=Austropuccinia psidii MF-1 TaxID=1389203 RepID=A0A9Q3H6N6_9BASI|nr:hypothetical protein [Austropuccinia psidii MF-1]